ncbi:hypothetical protein C1H46_017690 [Malus baccata]|uniref:Uncharacterized protein n=1 Tax=Malus baccata TaxID=106549 RepID=A0A540MD72_MALBA|nr:hypothetical protein C1H46_017690 [Malus baccata]
MAWKSHGPNWRLYVNQVHKEEFPTGHYVFRKSGDLVLAAIFCCLDDVDDDRYELVCLDLVSKQCTNLGILGYLYYYAESYVESLVLLDKTDAVSY